MMIKETARAAIEAGLADMQNAWNAHDASAYAAGLSEDVDYTNVFGITLNGRSAVTASHIAIFRGMFARSILTFTATRIRFIRDDVAAVEVRWQMDGALKPDGESWPRRYGLINMTAEQRGRDWSFVVFHNMDLPPPAQVAKIQAALAGPADS